MTTSFGDGPVAVSGPGMEVVRTGPQALVQDLGRPGHAALGVGRSGAADRQSLRAANGLLGNPDHLAAVECVLGGLVVRFDADLAVAVAGAPAPVTVDGEPAPHGTTIEVRCGQTVKLGVPGRGVRSYLAVAGGIDVPPVLGSRSTDTLSGIGPPPLARGDRLPIGAVPDGRVRADFVLPGWPTFATVQPVRAILGPRADWFVRPADLGLGEWVVTPDSNRVGIRLDRPAGTDPAHAPALGRAGDAELPSEGVALGSVQVPPGGRPVLFLPDHPVTGGYPVIAVVIGADVDLAAQARPGQRIRFVLIPSPVGPQGSASA